MKKMFLFLLAGILLLFTGCDFLEGPPGADGISANAVPGGTLNFTGTGLTADSAIVIVFDPDVNLLDGGESVLTIPLAPYLGTDPASFATTWYAPEVVPGSYYVYYWLDFLGDGDIDPSSEDGGMEESTVNKFDLAGTMVFDFVGAVPSITSSGSGVLFPNYTVWEDYAPQLSLEIIFNGW